MFKIKKVEKIRQGFEPWLRWKVQRSTLPSHHVYDYNLKKLPELRPSGKSWHKIIALLGKDYVSILIMEEAPVLSSRLYNQPLLVTAFDLQ